MTHREEILTKAYSRMTELYANKDTRYWNHSPSVRILNRFYYEKQFLEGSEFYLRYLEFAGRMRAKAREMGEHLVVKGTAATSFICPTTCPNTRRSANSTLRKNVSLMHIVSSARTKPWNCSQSGFIACGYDLTNLYSKLMKGNYMSTLKNDLIDILSSKLDYFSPIVVTGNSGVGKTRFLEMLKEELSDNQDENAIEIYNAEVISNSMLSALRSANMNAWRESFKKNSILMIDDFNYLGGKSSTQEELLSILRAVDVPIIISISRPISSGYFSDEMVSFFDNATHIHLKEPSHTEISEYTIKLLKDNDVRLSEEALNWLLSQNIESYAKVQGIIKTLSLYCSSYEKIVDVEVCKEIITPMIGMISKVFFEV